MIKLRAKWTGDLIREMHIHEVTQAELAKEMGIGKGYISMILNCARTPADAQERAEAAYRRILEKRKANSP